MADNEESAMLDRRNFSDNLGVSGRSCHQSAKRVSALVFCTNKRLVTRLRPDQAPVVHSNVTYCRRSDSNSSTSRSVTRSGSTSRSTTTSSSRSGNEQQLLQNHSNSALFSIVSSAASSPSNSSVSSSLSGDLSSGSDNVDETSAGGALLMNIISDPTFSRPTGAIVASQNLGILARVAASGMMSSAPLPSSHLTRAITRSQTASMTTTSTTDSSMGSQWRDFTQVADSSGNEHVKLVNPLASLPHLPPAMHAPAPVPSVDWICPCCRQICNCLLCTRQNAVLPRRHIQLMGPSATTVASVAASLPLATTALLRSTRIRVSRMRISAEQRVTYLGDSTHSEHPIMPAVTSGSSHSVIPMRIQALPLARHPLTAGMFEFEPVPFPFVAESHFITANITDPLHCPLQVPHARRLAPLVSNDLAPHPVSRFTPFHLGPPQLLHLPVAQRLPNAEVLAHAVSGQMGSEQTVRDSTSPSTSSASPTSTTSNSDKPGSVISTTSS